MNLQNSTKKLDESQEVKSHWQKYGIQSRKEKLSTWNSPIGKRKFFKKLGKLGLISGITVNTSYDLIKFGLKGLSKPENLSEQEIKSLVMDMPDLKSKDINPVRTHYLTYPEQALRFLDWANFVLGYPEAWSPSKVRGYLLLTSTLANSNYDVVKSNSDYNEVSNKAHNVLHTANFDKHIGKVRGLDAYLTQRMYLFAVAEAEGKYNKTEVIRCANFIYWHHTVRELQNHLNFEVVLAQDYYEDSTNESFVLANERKQRSKLQRDLNVRLIVEVLDNNLRRYLKKKNRDLFKIL